MTTKIASFLALLLTTFSTALVAQQVDPDIGFAIGIGGNSNEHGNAIAADGMGNYFVAGHFYGTLILGEDEYTSNGNQDAFIAKLDGQGELIWGLPFGGNGADEALAVATDALGNCYVTGLIGSQGVVILDQTLPSGSGYDVFVLKFSPTGALLWWRTYGGASNDIGRSIAVTTEGNISLAGSFQGTMTVGETTLVSSAQIDSFALQLDAQGNALWATLISGPNLVEARGLAVDTEGHTYVSGDFLGGAIAAGDFNALGFGSYDIFLVKIDENGIVLNLQAFGSTGADSGVALATDPSGNVFMSGYFEGSFDIGTINVESNGNRDMIVVKLNTSGDAEWAQTVGITGNDIAYALDTDDQGHCYYTGLFAGTVSVGAFELTGGGTLVAKLSPEGEYLWAMNFADSNVDNGGRGITVDQDGGITIVGNYLQPFEIGESEVGSTNGRDIYVVRINSVDVVNVEDYESMSLLAYPNPATHNVMVEGLSPNSTLQLVNGAGQIVWQTNTTGTHQRLDVSHLPTGIYFFWIDRKHSIKVLKIQVMH